MSKYASKYKGKKIQSSQNKLNTIFLALQKNTLKIKYKSRKIKRSQCTFDSVLIFVR